MMLIKTSDPVRQIERMLEKRERRRRLARRQDHHQDESVAGIATSSVLTEAQQDLAVSSRAWHRAKPRASIVPRPDQKNASVRGQRDIQTSSHANLFPL